MGAAVLEYQSMHNASLASMHTSVLLLRSFSTILVSLPTPDEQKGFCNIGSSGIFLRLPLLGKSHAGSNMWPLASL